MYEKDVNIVFALSLLLSLLLFHKYYNGILLIYYRIETVRVCHIVYYNSRICCPIVESCSALDESGLKYWVSPFHWNHSYNKWKEWNFLMAQITNKFNVSILSIGVDLFNINDDSNKSHLMNKQTKIESKTWPRHTHLECMFVQKYYIDMVHSWSSRAGEKLKSTTIKHRDLRN